MVCSKWNEDGTVKGIVVSCSCGCSMLSFTVMDEHVYISGFDSGWYSHYGLGTVSDNVKHLADRIRNRKHIAYDVIVSRNELDEFLSLAENMGFSSEFIKDTDEDDFCTADSHLALECLGHKDIPKEATDYCIQIRSDMPLAELMKNNGYRAADIWLSKEKWEALVGKMRRYVEYLDGRNLSHGDDDEEDAG